jgi:hypothetical protein
MFALAVDKTTPFGTNATPRAVNGACVRPAHGLHVMRHHRRACATELAGTAGTRKPDRSAVSLLRSGRGFEARLYSFDRNDFLGQLLRRHARASVR